MPRLRTSTRTWGVRLAAIAVAVVAASTWDGPSDPGTGATDRVASAQLAPPSGPPTRTPTPRVREVVAQPTATRTPLPESAPATATPTRPAFSDRPTPTPTPTPAPAGRTPTPTPTPSGNPGTPTGGPTAPTATPRPESGEPVPCDFDGDGKGDLAVGVPGEDYGRGGVNVQYNQGGFLAKSAFLQAQHPEGDKVLENAYFGTALACGDFNGDRLGDLAVGGPGTSLGGNVWLLWGKQGVGLDASFYWVFHQTGDRIPGSQEGRFGQALAVGDFNGDGVDDLAVGDPDEPDPASGDGVGTVLVVEGRKGLLKFEDVQQLWGWPVEEGENVGHFGWSLAAAPLVSGGGDDLVVGAPYTDVECPSRGKYAAAGRAYLFRDHGGLVPHQVIDEAAIALAGLGCTDGIPDAEASFGHALATGDFNGDGKADLAVGIPRRSLSQGGGGAAVILPGTGLELDLAESVYVFQEAVGGASETGDLYGWALAAGDWNVDYYDDLAVGAPQESVGDSGGNPGVLAAGAVFVHYGGPGLVSGEGQILAQGSGVTPGTPQSVDWFGMSLASVRLVQSAADYLVIGIPGEKLGSVHPDCRLAGAVQLGAGWPDLGPIADPTYLLHQDTEDPYNVADQRECTTAFPHIPLFFGEPPVVPGRGEFFGFATGS